MASPRSLPFHSRKKAAHPEAVLQKRIVQFLLMNDAMFFAIPNEGKRSVVMGAHLKQMGMIPGAADLGIVVDGKIHFLEVKSAEGVQSASQRNFQASCAIHNIPYAVCYSLTDALKVLSDWRAIKQTRVAA